MSRPAKTQVQAKQEHGLKRYTRLSQQRYDVREALRFFHKGDWYSLYKAYELVSDDVHGRKGILSRNFVSKTSLNRFTQMAHNEDDEAHAYGLSK